MEGKRLARRAPRAGAGALRAAHGALLLAGAPPGTQLAATAGGRPGRVWNGPALRRFPRIRLADPHPAVPARPGPGVPGLPHAEPDPDHRAARPVQWRNLPDVGFASAGKPA